MSGIIKNDAGNPIYPLRGAIFVNETYKVGGSTFNVGASPLTLNVAGSLTPSVTPAVKNRNGNRGYIAVDGAGDLLVQWSNSGTAYLTQITLRSGEKFDLTGLDVAQLLITHSGTDTNFRVLAL